MSCFSDGDFCIYRVCTRDNERIWTKITRVDTNLTLSTRVNHIFFCRFLEKKKKAKIIDFCSFSYIRDSITEKIISDVCTYDFDFACESQCEIRK